jgi:hypothetical protein
MQVLDLFNTKFERQVTEGAIDNLEARYIDNLNAKMDDLVQRARAATDPEHKTALKREYEKVKGERASYFSNSKQEVDEKLKHFPKKLGSSRDIGKSVKKFRAQRGLDEGSMKQWLWSEAERMSKERFVANV